jgi:uncharacterized protein (DUF3820 family)
MKTTVLFTEQSAHIFTCRTCLKRRKKAQRRKTQYPIKPTKLAVVGSRAYPNLELVEEFIASLPPHIDTIVSGGAAGVDTTAEIAARARGLNVITIRPNWKAFGRYAGFARNALIVKEAHKVIAFWDTESKGTLHTIHLAQKVNKLHRVIGPDGETVTEIPKEALSEQEKQQVSRITHASLAKMTMLFGEFQGLPFDQVPLTYLDWLCNQEWFTGKARIYTEMYLSHPTIQRELEQERIEAAQNKGWVKHRFGFHYVSNWTEIAEDEGWQAFTSQPPPARQTNPHPDPDWKELRYLNPAERDASRQAVTVYLALIAKQDVQNHVGAYI